MAQTQTLAQVIEDCRSDYDDTLTSNLARQETPQGNQNGTNKSFRVQNRPIAVVASVPQFTLYENDVVIVNPTDYTVDASTAEIMYAIAPAFADKLAATYYWFWFTDDQWTKFIIKAGEMLGRVGVGSTDAIRAADLLDIKLEQGLLPALKAYVGYHFNFRRAETWAVRFSSSSGGQSVNVDVVTRNFRDLATDLKATGDKLRDDFYLNFGANNRPSTRLSTMNPLPRYTPRR